jgi:murein L,D-transpeptidase YcbB/YkuD
MNVVTGSVANNTVIFSGRLKYIVLAPTGMYCSILKKEVLPGIGRNKNYLANHNMEWNNERQKPGPQIL